MSNKGIVTREDVFQKDAITAPLEYAKNLQIAIDLQKQIVVVLTETNQLSKDFKGAKTSKEIIGLKSKEVKLQQKYADLLTKQRRSELKMQKIKETQISILNKKITLKNKLETKKRRSITLSVDEKLAIKQTNRELAQEAILNSKLVGAYQKLNLKRTIAKKKLQDLISTGKASRLEIKLATTQFEKYDTKVKKADRAVGDFTKNVGNYKSAFKGLGGVVRGLVGAFGFTSGIYIFSNLVKGAFNRIREFDKSMQNLSGILRVNRGDLKDLEETIINVAGSSVKTSNEVATLAEKLITLGKTKEDVKKLLQPVVDLGIGLETTSEEAGEFLVQMLNTFGASTDEAGKYADTIATIRTSTSLDFQKMRDSFQYLAPISRVLNKDLAYTGSLVGILADNGIKAERAGRLMGTSQQKLAADGKSLNDALNELNEAKARNVSELELLALSSKLFGKQSSALGLVLANNTDLIEENAQAIRDNGGALDDLVSKQMESMDAKLKILDSSWEELILTVENGEGALSQSFKGFIETITFAIQKTTELEKAQSKLAKIGVETNGWRTFFNTVLPGLGLLGSGYEDAEKAQLKFNKTNEGIEKNSISMLNIMRDQIFQKVRLKDLSKEEEKVYLNQIKVINKTIDKKREERQSLEDNAIALDFNNKELGKYSDNISNYTDGDLKRYIEANKESTKVIIKETEAQKKLREEKEKKDKNESDKNNSKLNESLKKSEFELANELIQINIDKNNKIIDNEKSTFEEKLKANINLKNNLIKLNNNEINEEKRQLKEKLDGKLILQDEYIARLQILAIKTIGINEDIEDEITENFKESLKERLDAQKSDVDNNIADWIAKGKAEIKAQKEVEEKRKEIIKETSDFIADALGLDSNNLNDLITGLFDGFEDGTEKLTASLKVVGDVLNSITSISGDFSQARIDAIDVEIEKNDEKFNKLLDNENLTEEQRSLLEARKKVEEDQLEEKKRKEKNKQAKLEKANTLVQIAIQTSLGVISALAQVPKFDFGISATALASVIGGIGAVQFALAAAQPIPKFAKGTNNAPKGLAIVDEIGSEIHTDKKGNIKSYGSDGGANYRFLEEGDKIIPHNQSLSYLEMAKQNIFKDLNGQQNKVNKSQKILANDSKVNEILIASIISREFSKHANSKISSEIKKGFKNVKVEAKFTEKKGNTIYKNTDW